MTTDFIPGDIVNWTDDHDHEHQGVVTAFDDPPPHFLTTGQVYVVETLTVEVPNWIAPARLRREET